MDRETLERVDEVRKRVPASHADALKALEEADQDVMAAVMALEQQPLLRARQALENVQIKGPAISLRRQGKDFFKLPLVAGLALLVAGIFKPKYLFGSAAVIALTGTDLAYHDGEEGSVSLRDTLSQQSKTALDKVQDTKGELEYAMADYREFRKDRTQGEKYYTIKL